VRFSIDRRWAILAVAVLLGAGGGSLLGFVTTQSSGEEATRSLGPAQEVAPSTTRRPRSRFAGVSSTTTRPRPRVLPAATAGLTPATSAPTSTVRPTTTTARPTTSAREPTTTTTSTTIGGGTTTTSSSTPPSSTTSTT
jgi:hypothetical protein